MSDKLEQTVQSVCFAKQNPFRKIICYDIGDGAFVDGAIAPVKANTLTAAEEIFKLPRYVFSRIVRWATTLFSVILRLDRRIQKVICHLDPAIKSQDDIVWSQSELSQEDKELI